jgi:nitroreductase
MDVDRAIRSLRAGRRYSGAPVGDGLVTRWIDAARWCGSSKNSQPWRFVAVRRRSTLHALSALGEHAGHLAHCDVAVVVLATPAPYAFSMAFDLGRIAQSLMLLAHDDGVSSCVAVFGPESNVAAAGAHLGIPAEWTAHLGIAFGFPADDGGGAVAPGELVSPPGRLPVSQLLYRETVAPGGGHAIR